MDRSNTENKILDFLDKSHSLYREIKHQEVLTEKKLSIFFSQQGYSRASWLQFFLCGVINLLLLSFYAVDSTGDYHMPKLITEIVSYLLYILFGLSTFTLIMSCVLKGPLAYEFHISKGETHIKSLIQSVMDPEIVYYTIYCLLAGLACFYEYLFVTLLLLDLIKKNSTTRNVLNAVIYPRKQIFFTAVLLGFTCFIFSFIYVSYCIHVKYLMYLDLIFENRLFCLVSILGD